MISAKNLTDEQVAEVKKWAEEGEQLAGIQKRLQEEFGLNATYMDTRFLILDLGVDLQSEEAEEESAATTEGEVFAEEAAPETSGGVTVTTDELIRPGAMVSGSVVFSDGQKARWWFDQMGPGLDPETPGYQPSQDDLVIFEQKLRTILQGMR